MVFQQLGDGAHLVVHNGCVAGRESRLMVDNDLPRLLAGIEVMDYPLAESGRICSERGRGRVEGISAGQIVVEEMRIGVEEKNVGIAVVERIVALMIDLQLGPFAGIDQGRIAKRGNRRGRGIGLALISEGETSGCRSVTVPRVLDVVSLRSVLREIEVVEEGESISTA
jgi:hypothetical protein